jgi:putative acetyltransferase
VNGLRPATDADSPGIIELIGAVFAEYPGCVLDVDREEPELRTPASSFDRFWVVEEEGRIVACIGCALRGDITELKKLYVARAARRRGIGRRLVALVEETARGAGANRVELWSDTRFTDAHALYLALGYAQLPETRELHDLSRTVEHHFLKILAAGGRERT